MKFRDIVLDTLIKDTEAGAEWDCVTQGDAGRYWYECRRENAFTKIVPGLFGHRFLMLFLNDLRNDGPRTLQANAGRDWQIVLVDVLEGFREDFLHLSHGRPAGGQLLVVIAAVFVHLVRDLGEPLLDLLVDHRPCRPASGVDDQEAIEPPAGIQVDGLQSAGLALGRAAVDQFRQPAAMPTADPERVQVGFQRRMNRWISPRDVFIAA